MRGIVDNGSNATGMETGMGSPARSTSRTVNAMNEQSLVCKKGVTWPRCSRPIHLLLVSVRRNLTLNTVIPDRSLYRRNLIKFQGSICPMQVLHSNKEIKYAK